MTSHRSPVFAAAAAAVASLSLCAAPALAEDGMEVAGVIMPAHRTVDGASAVLVGAGLRKKFIIKVYAMSLYVDEAGAKAAFPALAGRAGGKDHDHLVAGDAAEAFLMGGSFSKLGVLHFLRDVDAPKIQEAYQESLADELSDKAPADQRAAAQAFIALFDHDMKEGQEVLIHTSTDGQVDVTVAGLPKKMGPKNVKFTRAIWGIWLGSHPISAGLRTGLVERIAVLGN